MQATRTSMTTDGIVEHFDHLGYRLDQLNVLPDCGSRMILNLLRGFVESSIAQLFTLVNNLFMFIVILFNARR